MDMEITSDEKALTLAATNEHTCPAKRQITCDGIQIYMSTTELLTVCAVVHARERCHMYVGIYSSACPAIREEITLHKMAGISVSKVGMHNDGLFGVLG